MKKTRLSLMLLAASALGVFVTGCSSPPTDDAKPSKQPGPGDKMPSPSGSAPAGGGPTGGAKASSD